MADVDTPAELQACPYCANQHAPELLKCSQTDMPLPLAGRMLSGKFRFIRRLGKGGMASVWLALNTAVDREVAIKLIRPEVLKSEDLVARFRSEAKAAGRIDHPNICEILDFGVGPVGPYIVMEYLRGENLAEILKRRGPLPPARAVALVSEALLGLQAAHDRGIVHRDLKPENVFVHEPPAGDPIVKLMDFGVAKFTDGSAEVTTAHGALLGTPEYMAPEQFKGADLAEVRTDVWAVGAILYRTLTGKHAFKGPTVAATLLMVTHDEPKAIEQLQPEVPRALIDVVKRCMAKAIPDRFDNIAHLQKALTAALDHDDDEGTTTPLPSLRELEDLPPLDDDLDDDALPPFPSGLDAPPPPELADTAPAEPGELERLAAQDDRDDTSELRSTANFRTAPTQRAWLPWVLGAVVVGLVAWIAWPKGPDEDAKLGAASPPQAPAVEPDGELEPDPQPEPVVEPVSARLDMGNAEPEPIASRLDVGTPEPEPEIVIEEDDDDGVPPPPAPRPELPEGVIEVGNDLVMTRKPGKRSDHGTARDYCKALGVTNFAGFSKWTLPFPGAVAHIVEANPGLKGQFWTSARHNNNVRVFVLPSGKVRKGVSAKRKVARPLCIAKQ